MQHMVWWDILKAQSWCISPTVVVRLGKEYIYIWVCKCNRTWDIWHFFFFFLHFFLIMILNSLIFGLEKSYANLLHLVVSLLNNNKTLFLKFFSWLSFGLCSIKVLSWSSFFIKDRTAMNFQSVLGFGYLVCHLVEEVHKILLSRIVTLRIYTFKQVKWVGLKKVQMARKILCALE